MIWQPDQLPRRGRPETLRERFRTDDDHRIVESPHHINDPEFAATIVAALEEITGGRP